MKDGPRVWVAGSLALLALLAAVWLYVTEAAPEVFPFSYGEEFPIATPRPTVYVVVTSRCEACIPVYDWLAAFATDYAPRGIAVELIWAGREAESRRKVETNARFRYANHRYMAIGDARM